MVEDHTLQCSVGFRVGPYMGRIHWDYPLLIALLERWDSSIGTFHIPTREMTIMVDSIHHLYCLSIQVQWIHHVMDRESVCPNIITIYGADAIDGVLGDMFSGGFSYFKY